MQNAGIYDPMEQAGFKSMVYVEDAIKIHGEAVAEIKQKLFLSLFHGMDKALHLSHYDEAQIFAGILEELGVAVKYDEWGAPYVEQNERKKLLEATK